MRKHQVGAGWVYGVFVLLFATGMPQSALAQDWVPYTGVTQTAHAVTPPARALPKAPPHPGPAIEIPLLHRPSFVPSGQQTPNDPAVQTTTGTSLTASTGTGFNGVSYNGYYPPDPNLSVGGQDQAGHEEVVQITNVEFAVYDATNGTLLSGPTLINSLFSGLSGTLCATNNGGDPIVLWDKIAHRWLISQLGFTSNLRNDEQCIAISTGTDATGTYNAYGFSFNRLTDYPKFGVWSSSSTPGASDYYYSANLFSTSFYYGPVVCAFNGSDMQSGAATARSACVQGSTTNFSLLPSDFDGTPPATGEPNYFLELSTGGVNSTGSSLIMFPLLVTWTGSGGSINNATAITIPVSTYNVACSNGGTCIPQPNTSRQVDSLGDRLMYRLAFRNNLSTDGHETLVVNHSVDRGDGVVGIRWYEINSATGATFANSVSKGTFTGAVAQQGTFSGTDNNYRWMGSIAEDHVGDLAVGYSTSNGVSLYPSIDFTGRTPSDPSNTMESESTILTGTGAETGGSRWGDYSSMSVDPANDCTFWYTNEYFNPNASGGVAWNTYIGSFSFAGCGGAASSNFSLSASPSSVQVTQGSSGTSSVTVSPSGGYTGNVTLSVTTSLPAGMTVGFSPNPADITSAAVSSTMTVLTSNTTPAGTYNLTVKGTDGTLTNTTPVSVTVNAQATPDFTISPSPSSQTVTQGSGTSYTVTISPLNGYNGTVNLSASNPPNGAGYSFNPTSISGGSGSATLNVTTDSTTPAGSFTITITGTDSGGSPLHSTTVTLVVNAATTGDFSISATPPSASTPPKGTVDYSITVTSLSGFSGSVTLTASSSIPQSRGSISPDPVTLNSGGSAGSTVQVSVGPKTPSGSYPVTVTGTSGSLVHSVTVTLVVQ